mgnify:CR=1 FL=1
MKFNEPREFLPGFFYALFMGMSCVEQGFRVEGAAMIHCRECVQVSVAKALSEVVANFNKKLWGNGARRGAEDEEKRNRESRESARMGILGGGCGDRS